MTVAEAITRCETVAGLLSLLTDAWRQKPADAESKDMEAHVAIEIPIEQEVMLALRQYGAVVWGGQVWTHVAPVRIGVINHMPVADAEKCKWPYVPPPPPPAPVYPEKLAGFIAENPYNR